MGPGRRTALCGHRRHGNLLVLIGWPEYATARIHGGVLDCLAREAALFGRTRATDTSREKTSRPSGSDSWYRIFPCSAAYLQLGCVVVRRHARVPEEREHAPFGASPASPADALRLNGICCILDLKSSYTAARIVPFNFEAFETMWI